MAIFGLESDFVAILGLCVAGGSSVFTAFAFLITYGRSRKSEQIKIARDVRDGINNKMTSLDQISLKNEYPYEGSTEAKRKLIIELLRILIDAKAALRYFTFLVKQNEINDANILIYYKKANIGNLNAIDNKYEFIEDEMKHDANLATALRDVFPSDPSSENLKTALRDVLPSDRSSRITDPFSEIAKIRREISEDKEVWEHSPKLLNF